MIIGEIKIVSISIHEDTYNGGENVLYAPKGGKYVCLNAGDSNGNAISTDISGGGIIERNNTYIEFKGFIIRVS